jgi:shikimate dehydrogenase
VEVSGRTKVCGIIGNPVEHSLSPIMHNMSFQELNLDFVYVAFTVKKKELKATIHGVKLLGIFGLNVTMPHKQDVLMHLDKLDPVAESIGAVNTIVAKNGSLVGYNTDGVGAYKALCEDSTSLNGSRVLLLGAGGAAKAIACHLAKQECHLAILNRTPIKARNLARFLAGQFGVEATGNELSSEQIQKEAKRADILINATSVGMHPNSAYSLVKASWLRPEMYVMDIIYDPLETILIRDAKSIGAKVINGVDMLVHQGAISFEIWTGCQAPILTMRDAIFKELKSREK